MKKDSIHVIIGLYIVCLLTLIISCPLSQEPSIFTVTFNSVEATIEANPTSKRVESPATTIDELPIAPTKEGYVFEGWFTIAHGGGGVFTASTIVSESITVYAKWRELTYRDIGPSGGYIFYDKGSSSYGWRYLEAAPYGWYEGETDSTGAYIGDDDPLFQWGAFGYEVNPSATATEIGSGKTNTANIVSYHDSLGTLYPGKGEYYDYPNNYDVGNDGFVAAKMCADYRGGGNDDWFLPSKEELRLMRSNLYNQEVSLGGFSDESYWSSSEGGDSTVWFQNFSQGSLTYYLKTYHERVRPIRAF